MAEPIRAFWCRVPSRPNVGDALTPWIVHRLTGSYPRFVPADDPRPKYLVTGSIIALAGPTTTVWGAGIMDTDDVVHPGAALLAVRGPLTAARAQACGAAAPDALGDPALLLSELYRPRRRPRAGVGLALHFADRPRLMGRLGPGWDERIIDLQAPVEHVADAVASCDLVASSSLHGMILAHAYGVPATWVEFRPLPSGDGSKFRDYLRWVGSDRGEPTRLDGRAIDERRLWDDAVDPPASIDRDGLWRSCPFTA